MSALRGSSITTTSGSTTTVTGARIIPLPTGGDVVRTGAGSSYYFEIPDPHGTSDLYLDSTAQLPTWRQFTPYGAPRGTTTTWIDNRGFLNKPNDPSAGLTYVGARAYDPDTGQFTSPDPVLKPYEHRDLNPYAYAYDNPVGNSDPSGLMLPGGDSGGPPPCDSGSTCNASTQTGGSGTANTGDGCSVPSPQPGGSPVPLQPSAAGSSPVPTVPYQPTGTSRTGNSPLVNWLDSLTKGNAAGMRNAVPQPCGAAFEERLTGCRPQPHKFSNNGSVGLCFSGTAFGGAQFFGSFCFIATTHSVGMSFSGGGGTGIPSYAVAVSGMASNATQLGQFRGPFVVAGGGVGLVGAEYQTGLDSNNKQVNVGSIGAGPSFDLLPTPGVPYSLYGGATDTVTWQWFRW